MVSCSLDNPVQDIDSIEASGSVLSVKNLVDCSLVAAIRLSAPGLSEQGMYSLE